MNADKRRSEPPRQNINVLLLCRNAHLDAETLLCLRLIVRLPFRAWEIHENAQIVVGLVLVDLAEQPDNGEAFLREEPVEALEEDEAEAEEPEETEEETEE